MPGQRPDEQEVARQPDSHRQAGDPAEHRGPSQPFPEGRAGAREEQQPSPRGDHRHSHVARQQGQGRERPGGEQVPSPSRAQDRLDAEQGQGGEQQEGGLGTREPGDLRQRQRERRRQGRPGPEERRSQPVAEEPRGEEDGQSEGERPQRAGDRVGVEPSEAERGEERGIERRPQGERPAVVIGEPRAGEQVAGDDDVVQAVPVQPDAVGRLPGQHQARGEPAGDHRDREGALPGTRPGTRPARPGPGPRPYPPRPLTHCPAPTLRIRSAPRRGESKSRSSKSRSSKSRSSKSERGDRGAEDPEQARPDAGGTARSPRRERPFREGGGPFRRETASRDFPAADAGRRRASRAARRSTGRSTGRSRRREQNHRDRDRTAPSRPPKTPPVRTPPVRTPPGSGGHASRDAMRRRRERSGAARNRPAASPAHDTRSARGGAKILGGRRRGAPPGPRVGPPRPKAAPSAATGPRSARPGSIPRMIHQASPILALTAAAALSAPLPRLAALTVSVTEERGGGGQPGGRGAPRNRRGACGRNSTRRPSTTPFAAVTRKRCRFPARPPAIPRR